MALTLSHIGQAQLQVPVRIVLDGATEEQRQISGLDDPLTHEAAMSAGSARAGTASFCATTGGDILHGELTPAAEAYTAGMFVTIVPQQTNAANAMLDLNGLGARPMVKWGSVPLDSADLPAGAPARLVYDGSRFLLLNHVNRPCPAGSFAATANTCVDSIARPAVSFFDAVSSCHAIGARLCSTGEWVNACLTQPMFLPTVTAGEWVDDAANSSNDAKSLGNGSDGPNTVTGFGCRYGSTQGPLSLRKIRCCHSR